MADPSTPPKFNPPRPTLSEPTHYTLLALHPSASELQIRQSYRDRSRLYHPDTTALPLATAKQKFQQLNEAYATLSSPERRTQYDLSIGYSRLTLVMPYSPNRSPATAKPTHPQPNSITEQYENTGSAYLDATDRPLSPGELFALLIMLVTFVGCLVVALVLGLQQQPQAIQAEFAQELGLIAPNSAANPQPNDRFREPVRLERESLRTTPPIPKGTGAKSQSSATIVSVKTHKSKP